MRYMLLIKPNMEKFPEGGPGEDLMTEMGKLLDEMTKAGVLLDTAGLAPVEPGGVVRTSGGKLTVLDGPFTEAREVVGGYLLVQVKSHAEAVEWASRFLRVHGPEWEIDIEVRGVQEPPQ